MSNTKIFIVTSAVCLLLGAALVYFINKPAKVIVQKENNKAVIDSITKASQERESKLLADSAILSQQKNLLTVKYNEKVKSLNEARLTVASMTEIIKQARQLADTSSYFKYCDSLSSEVVFLDEQVAKYINAADSLNKVNDSLVSLMSLRVSQWRGTAAAYKLQATVLSERNDSLTTKYNKLAAKRFSVGIGVNAGGLISNGRVGTGVCIGITLTRNIFSF